MVAGCRRTKAPEGFAYGFRVDGPYEPDRRSSVSTSTKLLADPYARALKRGHLADDPALVRLHRL